jgi:hypothetical protein
VASESFLTKYIDQFSKRDGASAYHRVMAQISFKNRLIDEGVTKHHAAIAAYKLHYGCLKDDMEMIRQAADIMDKYSSVQQLILKSTDAKESLDQI